MRKIVVAMSGGVDSSVAALLLKEAGFDVIGLFMRTGAHGGGRARTCCSLSDSRDAGRVADRLGISFYRLDFEKEFETIIEAFVASYRGGRTPNPCISCNRDLKFGRLLEYADAVGADAVATGHYASVVSLGARYALRRGADLDKDQSYVLFPLTQEQLARTVLPLGEMSKTSVREKAREGGLLVADKAESQEICFVPEGGRGALLADRGGPTPGPILDEEGREIGRHPGYELFTIGQRRGLGLALGRPVYVVAIDPERAAVTVAGSSALFARTFTVSGWVGGAVPCPGTGEGRSAHVKIRYRHEAAAAELAGLGDARVRVTFSAAQSAITPGQAAVAYDGDLVLGGGWIEEVVRSE